MRLFGLFDKTSNLHVSQGGDLPPIAYLTFIVVIILVILGATGVY